MERWRTRHVATVVAVAVRPNRSPASPNRVHMLSHAAPRAPMRLLGAAVLAIVGLTEPAAAQIFAHRTMLPVALDDTTRRVGFLPGFTYMAELQRGWQSAADDLAWAARLAGTIELWRVAPRTGIVIGTADELVANSLRDGGFNPRGITWELSIVGAHRFERLAGITAELGFVHYCRHGIDNLDPPGPALHVPDYVPTQRTISFNAPRLRLISAPTALGRRVRVRGAITGERYQDLWDGRSVDGSTPTRQENSWIRARGSAAATLRLDATAMPGSTLFVRGSAVTVFFDGSARYPVTSSHRSNGRIELGWRAARNAGALELYGTLEQVFDDLGAVAPRRSRVAGIGLRLAERNQF